MAEFLIIHPEDPQPRLLARVVTALTAGGVIVYPTDSSYALGCQLGDKNALSAIRQIRGTEIDHEFTLVCRDLSELARYARVDNWAYRLMRSLTPGPYTFILKATNEVPKRIQDRRKTIGIRVPKNVIAQRLLEQLGQPILSSTLLLPNDDRPLTDPHEIRERVGKRVEVIIDGGPGGLEPTTVLDLTSGEMTVIRRGLGDVTAFEH
jgi:tRNA threonylcarbamoyl adenosine modification protein (Sua5/YciO/YrdC/YwlC family)